MAVAMPQMFTDRAYSMLDKESTAAWCPQGFGAPLGLYSMALARSARGSLMFDTLETLDSQIEVKVGMQWLAATAPQRSSKMASAGMAPPWPSVDSCCARDCTQADAELEVGDRLRNAVAAASIDSNAINVNLAADRSSSGMSADSMVSWSDTDVMQTDMPLSVEVSNRYPQGATVRLSQPACNPGSFGHPDLCLRPCLYFASGSCSNGNHCEFCHLQHPRRPSRLDKRNRATFDKMSPAQRFEASSPIIRKKAEAAGLLPQQVEEFMSTLENELQAEAEAAPAMPPLKHHVINTAMASRSFLSALEAMSLRCLVSMLYRTPRASAIPDVLEKFRHGRQGLVKTQTQTPT